MWILGLFLFNTFFLLILSVREVRRPAIALNWLTICIILPIIGFGLYLSTSNPTRIRRKRLILSHNNSDTLPNLFGRSAAVIAHALQHFAVHGLRSGEVQVLMNGIDTYRKLIESITHAKKTIDLEYYLYKNDQIGKQIIDLLIDRAISGVQVRFIRDGWGSRKFPQQQISRMLASGIECRTFFPVRFPWIMSTWNYRNHSKIVVIDGQEAFTGGINVGFEYTGLKPSIGYWRDTHLRIKDDAAVDLQVIFDAHWIIATPERKKIRNNKKEVTQSEKTPALGRVAFSGWSTEWNTELGTLLDTSVETVPTNCILQKAYVQTLEGNPGIPTPMIREAYFICLTQATKSIDITSPYFLPDEDSIVALKTAVARGIHVRLLVPRHSDQKIADLASYTYYGGLLEAGVHIYLYNKGMLHAKLMVIDGEISQIGSANFDLRSHRFNYEVCQILYSADVASELTEQFEHDLNDSIPLSIEDVQQRTLSQRIFDQGARLIAPML